MCIIEFCTVSFKFCSNHLDWDKIKIQYLYIITTRGGGEQAK